MSWALKSLSPSEYFCSIVISPPMAAKVSLKYLARPTLYGEDTEVRRATFFRWRLFWANFAIAVPWKGSMKQTRKM